jgi:excisionase family DNA binding protein
VSASQELPSNADELLTPARAAAIASRSVKTIRRAYSSGRLHAYRDGGGRGVRIAYRDLRTWLTAEELGRRQSPSEDRSEILAFARERHTRRS